MRKLLVITTILSFVLVGCSSIQKNGYTGTLTKETPYGTSKDTVITSVEFDHGKPVSIQFDVRMENGKSIKEESKKAKYIMKQDEEIHWHQQIEQLENFLKENNFNLSKVPVIDDLGHTDAISTVTIKVSPFLEAYQQILKEAKDK